MNRGGKMRTKLTAIKALAVNLAAAILAVSVLGFGYSVAQAQSTTHTKRIDPIYWYSYTPNVAFNGPYSRSTPAIVMEDWTIANSAGQGTHCTGINLRPMASTPYLNGRPTSWEWDGSCVTPGDPPTTQIVQGGTAFLNWNCSDGWSPNGTSAGSVMVQWCELPVAIPADVPKMCMVKTPGLTIANPIVPATGSKIREETDWADSGQHPLSVVRFYASNDHDVWAFGFNWTHELSIKLLLSSQPIFTLSGAVQIDPLGIAPFGEQVSSTANVAVFRAGNGSKVSFQYVNGTWTADWGTNLLTQSPGGYLYQTSDGKRYAFDFTGKLLTLTEPNGWTMTHSYDLGGHLSQVTNHFGRTLSFGYTAENRLVQVTTPDGQLITYTYDGANHLTQVGYPDGATRSFHYEDTNYPYALTGISVNGARIMTFAYDAQGRAITSQLAGGAESYQVAYNGAVGEPVTVTDPLGTQRNYSYSTQYGKIAVTYSSIPVGYGANDAQSRSQNSSGLVDWESDFLGTQTFFTWDLARRLPTSVKRAANQATETTTSTQWHPTQPVPAKVAEPGVLTTNVYNGQPDPFSGGAVANCAPPTAVLPDGSKIAVLCKRVEQATTDVNGASGLTPTLQSGIPARVWSWTYNADAQVLTETNPLNYTSYFTYYTDTSSTHTRGDLLTSANALGHTTQYIQYNGAGNLLQSTDPNGVITLYAYDTRQRLTSVNVGGQTTSYSYTPAGLLNVVTLPNSSTITYSYDAAQRLTGVADSLGNSISYTLDNAGNRTAEQIKDPSGTLSRQVNRVFDALGRQQQVSGLQ
jgi:YD repeat-containing protein